VAVRVQSGSLIRRRVLGRELRRLRKEANYTLEAAAPLLDWSPSKLCRIEMGKQAVDVHGVRGMLDLYDAGGDPWKKLVTLARESRQKGWWQAYGLGEHTFYIGYEAEASGVRDFTVDLVPGLLQTSEYSRALFVASPVCRSDEELANEVTVRMIRQQRLTSSENPLELVSIINEDVLHRPVGGIEVLRQQLCHLAVAAELPSVTLQVLPRSVGAHTAMGSGFVVLSFGDLGEPDMAYVEHALGALLMDEENDVARARLSFDRLRSDALSPAESLALIQRVAEKR